MLRARLDLIPPQRQRSLLPAQPRIHTTRITHLRARLAPPPHRRVPCETVAALRARVLRVGDLRLLGCVVIRVDELLRAQLIALLEVQPAGVAQRALCGGIAAPQRRARDVAVRT